MPLSVPREQILSDESPVTTKMIAGIDVLWIVYRSQWLGQTHV